MFAHAISKRKPTAASIMRKPERWSPRSARSEWLEAKAAVLVIDWVLLLQPLGDYVELRLALCACEVPGLSRAITFR